MCFLIYLQSAFEDLSRAPGEKKVTFDVSESDLSSSVGPPVQRGDPAVPPAPRMMYVSNPPLTDFSLSPRRVPAAHLGAAQLRPQRLGLADAAALRRPVRLLPCAVGPASLRPRGRPTPPGLELGSPRLGRAALQHPHHQRAETLPRADEQSLEPDIPRYSRTFQHRLMLLPAIFHCRLILQQQPRTQSRPSRLQDQLHRTRCTHPPGNRPPLTSNR